MSASDVEPAQGPAEARALGGGFPSSTGPGPEVGGSRKTPCRMDIPLRHCDVLPGARAVVRGGGAAEPITAQAA